MDMTFSMLADALGSIRVLFCSESSSAVFKSVQMYSEKQAVYLADVLYICTYEQVVSGKDSLPGKILCVSMRETDDTTEVAECGLVMHICTEHKPEDVFRIAEEALIRFQSWSSRLLQTIIDNKGVATFLDIAHEMIGNPIMVTDINSCLVAYTQSDVYDHEIWKVIIDTGYITYMDSSPKRIEDLDHAFWDGTAPKILNDEAVPDPLLVSKVFVDHKAAAMMIVVAIHKGVTAGMIDYCLHACNLLSLEFRNRAAAEKGRNANKEFLLDLIKGNFRKRDQIQSRLEHIDWSPGRNNTIMVAPCNSFDENGITAEKAAGQLQMILTDSIIVIYKESIVCLVPHRRREPLSEFVTERLELFLKEYDCHLGISDSFEDLMKCREEYSNALQTVKTALSGYGGERIHHYPDYAFLNIRNILMEHQPIETFCDKALFKLMEYDSAMNTDYTYTLYLYIRNNLSPGKTAEQLFIHRSSINHRLKKIEEIAGIDLSNSEHIFSMSISYRLLDYPTSG